MFHRSTQGDCRSARTEHSEKQSHLGAVFPEGEKRPLLLCALSFPPGVQPRKGNHNAKRKNSGISRRLLFRKSEPRQRNGAGADPPYQWDLPAKAGQPAAVQGAPIASDRSGYFYATNAGEVYDTIRQLKQMVAGLEAAISGLERSMERFRERGEAGHG